MYLALSTRQDCHFALISKRLFRINNGRNCCKEISVRHGNTVNTRGGPLAPINMKLKFMKLRLEIMKLTYRKLCLLKLMNT
jgi:hypothetical protein